jgi:hypothetical protein
MLNDIGGLLAVVCERLMGHERAADIDADGAEIIHAPGYTDARKQDFDTKSFKCVGKSLIRRIALSQLV